MNSGNVCITQVEFGRTAVLKFRVIYIRSLPLERAAYSKFKKTSPRTSSFTKFRFVNRLSSRSTSRSVEGD